MNTQWGEQGSQAAEPIRVRAEKGRNFTIQFYRGWRKRSNGSEKGGNPAILV